MAGVVVRCAGARRAPVTLFARNVYLSRWKLRWLALRDVGELRPHAVERSSLGQDQGEPCLCHLPQLGTFLWNPSAH